MQRTPEEWKAVVLDQMKSGLTIAEYCKQHKITQSGFYRWRSEYKDELNIQVKSQSKPFKQVHIEPVSETKHMTLLKSQFNLKIGNWFQLSVNRSC